MTSTTSTTAPSELDHPPSAGRDGDSASRRRPPGLAAGRPVVRSRFLHVGEQKLYVRGVTYGTFRPDADGMPYGSPATVERDLAQMASVGLNAVRLYTPPPPGFLDSAAKHGLRVMVGLPWEEHITFLDDPARARVIERRMREEVRRMRHHPALLCYAIGNEIPAGIVRWHGRRRVEKFLSRLTDAVRAEDPAGLVTYVNYPSTEYLELPFIDLVCFNVYLESQPRLAAYLARLHNLAGNRPLLLTELGLDSRRNGLDGQAAALDWQVRTTFSSGSAGAFVFAWTDEWHRGGHDIDDWDFGLTTRERTSKPALVSVSRAFAEVPFPPTLRWPKISVVICSYNGERCIRDCLEAVSALHYPDYEVIVIDDGSADRTAEIAAEFDVQVVSVANGGLSRARNLGLEAARGEIIAYLDDDAYPDPDWLTFLASTFMTSTHVGVGGPNIPPPDDDFTSHCVASAPGGPIHVLLSDLEAEHIPGCNMAFRRAALVAVGGFDPQFRSAGDDVDVCWRLQARGHSLGFSPSAVVWHHRRNSIRAYWRQQKGYGRAEALLERKWPEKYNALGHVSWAGRLYGGGHTRALVFGSGRIYHGTFGTAPFQSIYEPAPDFLRSLPLMPEWYTLIATLAAISALGMLWWPLFLALPLLVLAIGASLLQAVMSGAQARPATPPGEANWPLPERIRFHTVTTGLHLLQPLARLIGRRSLGLTPWRRRSRSERGFVWPTDRRIAIWTENGQSAQRWMEALEINLESQSAVVARGGDYDDWDLEVWTGTLGFIRLITAIEEHGGGKQMLRFQIYPAVTPGRLAAPILLGTMAVGAAMAGAGWVSAILGLPSIAFAVRVIHDCGEASAAVMLGLDRLRVAAGSPDQNGDRPAESA
jgi:GT2 family glycosyltransferase